MSCAVLYCVVFCCAVLSPKDGLILEYDLTSLYDLSSRLCGVWSFVGGALRGMGQRVV